MVAEAVILSATIILVALCLLFGFSNGFHDAANAVATVIATKSLTPRQAVYSSAIFNFLPCLVQSNAVASTIAKIVSTTCISTHLASLDIPIFGEILPLPMIAGYVSWAICLTNAKQLVF
jgi:phosphate/sulfate permease